MYTMRSAHTRVLGIYIASVVVSLNGIKKNEILPMRSDELHCVPYDRVQ